LLFEMTLEAGAHAVEVRLLLLDVGLGEIIRRGGSRASTISGRFERARAARLGGARR
jgi:hypothetical protein